MTWRNLLPQDTRSVELASAGATVAFAMLLSLDGVSAEMMLSLRPSEFWAVVLGCLGFMQLLSLVVYPRLEVARMWTAWAGSCFWLWVGVGEHMTGGSILCVVVAGSNFYAFVLGVMGLGRTWKS